MAGDAHTTALDRLRRSGQRYTSNRRVLVDVLAEAARPMTIPEILATRRRLPQSSAYRNLVILEQAGVVRRVQSGHEFARFELAEDLLGHHHHLVCSSCGSVEDFDAPPELERAVVRASSKLARSNGFGVKDHQLQLTGLCSACA